jgi:hypothetical protein
MMAFNKQNFRNFSVAKTISCSCGGKAKFRSKKNYPFGKKSSSVNSNFYRCGSCGKVTFLNKKVGGKR